MTDAPTTTKYTREQRSKALLSTDIRGLDKQQKQKKLISKINDQEDQINTLSDTIKQMQQQINALLESNK